MPPGIPTNGLTSNVNIDLDWDNATPLDIVEALLPSNFWTHVKEQTNLYARQQIESARRHGSMKPHGILSKWKPVTIKELKNFFAIVIHMGLVQKA